MCFLAKLTSMSHVAGYRAANFITMGSPAYNTSPRTLQKSPTPPTDQQAQPPSQLKKQQAQPPSQLKKKPHHQQLKQTYCPTQHNLIHRPSNHLSPLDPWKLIDQELKNKINDKCKNVVYWNPRFIILSKNKPTFQFIELLNQQLLSLVEETPNSNVAMKAAMILPQLSLRKTKSETSGSNSKTLSCRIIVWKQGLLDELFTEAKALQIRHPKTKESELNEEVKQFDKLMSTGKISAALGCFSAKKTNFP